MINNVKDPTLRAMLKYKDHPSILAIQYKCKSQIKFSFEEIDLASIEKEIDKLKENFDIFADVLWKSIKNQLNLPLFLHALNRQM